MFRSLACPLICAPRRARARNPICRTSAALQALTCMQGCRAASARRQEQKCARPDTALPLRNGRGHAHGVTRLGWRRCSGAAPFRRRAERSARKERGTGRGWGASSLRRGARTAGEVGARGSPPAPANPRYADLGRRPAGAPPTTAPLHGATPRGAFMSSLVPCRRPAGPHRHGGGAPRGRGPAAAPSRGLLGGANRWRPCHLPRPVRGGVSARSGAARARGIQQEDPEDTTRDNRVGKATAERLAPARRGPASGSRQAPAQPIGGSRFHLK